MKRIAFLMIAAMALVMASCSKQDPETEKAVENQKIYTIYASFSNNESKTQIDENNTPLFVVGDEIWLHNGSASGKGKVTELVDGRGAKIETELFIKDKTVYAVYPYSAGNKLEGDELYFNISTSQNGTFAQANICASKGDDVNGLKFKNVTSVFKVTTKHADVKSFVLEKENIAGTYSINCEDMTITKRAASNKITVSSLPAAGPYYVAVATGLSYSANEVMAQYNKQSNQLFGKKKAQKDMTTARSKIYNLGETLRDGLLEGEFSVSETKKVHFAEGNLYWDGDSFEIEPNQFVLTTSWNPNHVSHFFWFKNDSETYDYTARSYQLDYDEEEEKSNGEALFTNKCYSIYQPNPNFTANNQTGIWRTLGSAEWNYLLGCTDDKTKEKTPSRMVNGGTGEGYCYVLATINGKQGLVIFPDDYTGSTTFSELPAKCVFLVANNYRAQSGGTIASGSNVGFYWTANCTIGTALSLDPTKLYFGNGRSPQGEDVNGVFTGLDNREYGFNIRLVMDI